MATATQKRQARTGVRPARDASEVAVLELLVHHVAADRRAAAQPLDGEVVALLTDDLPEEHRFGAV